MIRNLRELYQYRALTWSLTLRELKARYRGSVLGFLWTFLNPTLLMLVYAFVFGQVTQNPMRGFAYFMFVGLLPWIWFSTSIVAGASTISERRDLLTKVRFPAQVLPTTVVLTNLANYLLSLPLMLALGAFFHVVPGKQLVYFPLVLVTQLVFTLALSFLISALNVAFRDLQHIVSNFITLWFFITPIVYPATTISNSATLSPGLKHLILLGNPMAIVVDAYHDIFYAHVRPDLWALLGLAAVSAGLFWVASRVFESRREEFAELI